MAVTHVSTVLSVLVPFELMIRRNAPPAWWSAGQSAFRLILPGALFAAFVGGGVWFVQEKILHGANRIQDELRLLIRTGVRQSEAQTGRTWVTSPDTARIYSYRPALPN